MFLVSVVEYHVIKMQSVYDIISDHMRKQPNGILIVAVDFVPQTDLRTVLPDFHQPVHVIQTEEQILWTFQAAVKPSHILILVLPDHIFLFLLPLAVGLFLFKWYFLIGKFHDVVLCCVMINEWNLESERLTECKMF